MGPSVNEQATGIATEGAPLMGGTMGGLEKISPIVEYLLQMLSGGQQPQPRPSTTSQQVGPYRGPVATGPNGGPAMPGASAGLRQQMMGGNNRPQY